MVAFLDQLSEITPEKYQALRAQTTPEEVTTMTIGLARVTAPKAQITRTSTATPSKIVEA